MQLEAQLTRRFGSTSTTLIPTNLLLISGDLSGQGVEDTTTPITGALTALDVEGLTDGTIFSISSAASNGDASIHPSRGNWSYTPRPTSVERILSLSR